MIVAELAGLDSESLLIVVSVVNIFPKGRKRSCSILSSIRLYNLITRIWVIQFCTLRMQSGLGIRILPINVLSHVFLWIFSECSSCLLVYEVIVRVTRMTNIGWVI